MTYGVLINGMNTKNDLGMVMLDDLKISAPAVKSSYVDVPGIDGSLDYTEALTGYPLYEDRQVSFTLFGKYDEPTLAMARKAFAARFNGRVVHIETPDLPGYYWRGRVTMTDYGAYNSGRIGVNMENAFPYRLKRDVTVREISLAANTPVDVELKNDGMPTIPSLVCTSACTVTDADGNTYSLSANTEFKSTALMITGTKLQFTVEATAAATLTVTYQEGTL